jgi:hypothetical protein
MTRLTAIPVGPLLVLACWFMAGQWTVAGEESQLWLTFVAIVSIASIVPVPGRLLSGLDRRRRLRWWGWAAVLGLIALA